MFTIGLLEGIIVISCIVALLVLFPITINIYRKELNRERDLRLITEWAIKQYVNDVKQLTRELTELKELT